jgi:hypothetical protein
VVVPLTPPAIRIAPFPRAVAVCPCTGPGIAVVAVQVLVPLNSSAEASVVAPFEPPATSTCPLAARPAGSSVAVCPCRGDVIVPAVVQLPGPEDGLKMTAVARVVVPFLPPVNRMLPFASTVAVCPSRGLGIEASVLNADWTGSNRYTADIVAVPLLPPTSSTLLLSCALLVASKVAVCAC